MKKKKSESTRRNIRNWLGFRDHHLLETTRIFVKSLFRPNRISESERWQIDWPKLWWWWSPTIAIWQLQVEKSEWIENTTTRRWNHTTKWSIVILFNWQQIFVRHWFGLVHWNTWKFVQFIWHIVFDSKIPLDFRLFRLFRERKVRPSQKFCILRCDNSFLRNLLGYSIRRDMRLWPCAVLCKYSKSCNWKISCFENKRDKNHQKFIWINFSLFSCFFDFFSLPQRNRLWSAQLWHDCCNYFTFLVVFYLSHFFVSLSFRSCLMIYECFSINCENFHRVDRIWLNVRWLKAHY